MNGKEKYFFQRLCLKEWTLRENSPQGPLFVEKVKNLKIRHFAPIIMKIKMFLFYKRMLLASMTELYPLLKNCTYLYCRLILAFFRRTNF